MSVNEVKIKRAPTAFELRGTGPPTSRTFVIGDEDHTLGNALRHVLMNDPRVEFSGYCVPHPSEPVVHLRVQTGSKTSAAPKHRGEEEYSDEEIIGAPPEEGEFTAIDALKTACNTLASQCDFVLSQLEVAMPEVKVDKERLKRLEDDMLNKEEIEEEVEDMEE
jgi:DNA-directed RNA polymerase I and III subunit RPAC2